MIHVQSCCHCQRRSRGSPVAPARSSHPQAPSPTLPPSLCRFGLTAALPLAMFLPPAWRAEGDVGGLLRSFPSLAASSLVTTAGRV